MVNAFKNIMKDVCEISLQNELHEMTQIDMNQITFKTLSGEQINLLAKKIGLLPFDDYNILFFRYCFKNSVSEISKILDIENTEGKLRYVHKILSVLMGLENSWIDEKSMEEACKLALMEYKKEYDNIAIELQPNYSKTFRRKLKGIQFNNSLSIFALIMKRVAIFILLCLLGFSTLLAVNAEARSKFFDWFIKVFPKYSIFIPKEDYDKNDSTPIDLSTIKIEYIPIGFTLVDIQKGHVMRIYSYSDSNNKDFDIAFICSSSQGRSYFDTEGAEIEDFNFKDSKAYIWQTDEMTTMIWYQDGMECHISGRISKDEILKIAKNISK